MFATSQKACEKAAEQEKSIYDRAKNKTIYTNLCANLIKSLRTQQQSQNQAASQPIPRLMNVNSMKLNNTTNSGKLQTIPVSPNRTSYSHEAMLSGSKASRISYSINRVKQVEIKDLSSKSLIKLKLQTVEIK